MRDVVLHVGLAKTASTAIQNALMRDRDRLEPLGYRFAKFALGSHEVPNHSLHMTFMFNDKADNHHVVRRRALSVEREKAKSFEQLNDNLKGQGTLIISGEEIAFWNEESLERMHKWFRDQGISLRVVAYVRPVVSFMDSLTQQLVKDGIELRPQLSAAPGRLVQRLKAEFPSIEFLDYRQAAAHEGGPVAAFYSLFELSPPQSSGSARENVSLGDRPARLAGQINALVPMVIGGRPNPMRKIGDLNWLGEIPGPRFHLRRGEINAERLEDEVALLVGELGPEFHEDMQYLDVPIDPWSDDQLSVLREQLADVHPVIQAATVICLGKEGALTGQQFASVCDWLTPPTT